MTARGRAVLPGLLLLLPACGHRGDPLPPLRRTPPALADFRLAQRGEALEVSCRAPRASVDGVVLEGLTVEILWADGAVDLEKGGHRREVPARAGELVVERLPAPAPGTLVRAAARARVGGSEGPRTLIRALTAQAPLAPPTDLSGTLAPDGVVLEWRGAVPEPVPPPDLGSLGAPLLPDRPPRLAAPPAAQGETAAPDTIPHGFLVYRRVGEALDARAVAEVPSPEHRLVDAAPPLGQDACYEVRAVASVDPLIESAASNEVCVAVRDIAAPAAPAGVAVVPREEGLEVVWSPSPEADLAGYRVYRQSAEGPASRVADLPAGTSAFVDASAEPGMLHRYTVTALDAAGNESAPSSAVEARRR